MRSIISVILSLLSLLGSIIWMDRVSSTLHEGLILAGGVLLAVFFMWLSHYEPATESSVRRRRLQREPESPDQKGRKSEAYKHGFAIDTRRVTLRLSYFALSRRTILDTSTRKHAGFSIGVDYFEYPAFVFRPDPMIVRAYIDGEISGLSEKFAVKNQEVPAMGSDFEVGEEEFDDVFWVVCDGEEDAAQNLLSSDVRRGLLRLCAYASSVKLDAGGVSWTRNADLSPARYGEALETMNDLALALREALQRGANTAHTSAM